MTDSPLNRVIHLLTPEDLEPAIPAGEIVRADGSKQAVSVSLMAAIDHLLAAVARNQCIELTPLSRRQLFLNAASLTDMGEKRLREMVAEGRLPVTQSPAGDIVELKDVVVLNDEFRAARKQILRDMWDETLSMEPDYESQSEDPS